MKRLRIRVYYNRNAIMRPDYIDLLVEEIDGVVDIRKELAPRCDADTSVVLRDNVILAVESLDG